ncbi:hypothetical protein LOZ52_005852 [Ophidiomyces ophidiicola]|nr:hypothetical protein LOZ50_005621 [Ophidiomyces ophidiicola]KAI2046241.1 hypothetical protein LOZ38_005455 [Ophidiomyces ophidiicola]KAI2091374.1 hypothetical protein LOZ35_004964 [Ophidiomyces ophidiicola]KAI2152019.1 hypothetical protein LOZ26_005917 [Ophidiomyces ophidiicola]KAI2180838.1 hypothetical protein LOZ21_005502 [Ophidiomyces ophidiicola]
MSTSEAGSVNMDLFFLTENMFIVPEDVLKEITRGPLRTFILEYQDIQKIFWVWKCLLHTFSAANLPGPHNTAICNAISGFLESAVKSDNSQLHKYVLSEETWMSVFEIYLDRYQYGRPKPMKQVLATLLVLLIKHMDVNTSKSLSSNIGRSFIPILFKFEPRSRLKVSLVTLELLVRKRVIDVLDFVLLVQEWLWTHCSQWMPLFVEHCASVTLPFSRLADENERKELPPREILLNTSRLLCITLLLNMQNRDVSLPAGMLFSQLCYKLKEVSPLSDFTYYENGRPFWVTPLRHISLLNLDCLDPIANHILLPLFKMQPKDFNLFVATLPIKGLHSNVYTTASNEEYALLFSILELGKGLGLVHDQSAPGSLSPSVAEFSIILEPVYYRQFLLHAEQNIRIPALSLLITDLATAKPFAPAALRVLMDSLPYIHAETDSHIRSRLLGLFRKFVIRLRGSSNLLPATNSRVEEAISDATIDTKGFLHWYFGFLESELRPTASYQRHILALKILLLLIQSGIDAGVNSEHLSRLGQGEQKWRFNMDVYAPSLLRVIADLLSDPFDDVRETSLTLLRLCPKRLLMPRSDILGPGLYSQICTAIPRAEDMAGMTSRADHSDTVARLYHLRFSLSATFSDEKALLRSNEALTPHDIVDGLLENLEQSISCSPAAFYTALHNTPLQGYVSALRYISTTPDFHEVVSSSDDPNPSWLSFLERMLSVCWSIWFGVHDVLCADSPEREHESLQEDLVGPKDILSFSWRALRESSLLLNAILSNPTFAPSASGGIGYDILSRVGSLSFDQLAELRHRGAFSTVSHTFMSCCQRCVESNVDSVNALPTIWYQDAVRIIHEQGSKLTRRSAGIPAIVTGIASSQPNGALFREIMNELQDIARIRLATAAEGPIVELPQVHALNCLKDIFSNTCLAPRTEPYIMPALRISADCLGSNIWAIRNCGLMLFRALINRMSQPTPESRRCTFSIPGYDSTHSVPFEKYQGLVPLLSGLLDTRSLVVAPNHEQISSGKWDLSILTERIFPALELIGNKTPSRSSKNDETLMELAFCQLSNSVWAIRDHAARTYVSLVKRPALLEAAQKLSLANKIPYSQNQVHGLMLCLKYLLQKLWDLPSGYWRDNVSILMSVVEKNFTNYYSVHLAPYTKSCLFEILVETLVASIKCRQEDTILHRYEGLAETYAFEQLLHSLLKSISGSSVSRSSALLIRNLSFIIIVLKFLRNGISEEVLLLAEHVSVFDVNGACWLVQRFYQTFGSYRDTQFGASYLFTRLIETTLLSELKTVAMISLAETLGHIYEQADHDSSDFEYLRDWARLKDFNIIDEDSILWDRERANAYLYLEGCLFPLQLESVGPMEKTSTMRPKFRRYMQGLFFAMTEETVSLFMLVYKHPVSYVLQEFTTRLAAIASLKCFVLGLRRIGVTISHSPLLVDIYFILYDMLNDDEEELRIAAAHIAPLVFEAEFLTPTLPLLTATTVANLLPKHFSTSPDVFRAAIIRFMGTRPSTVTFRPISEHFAEFRERNTVLFVKEKQNLYMDEHREIEIWSAVLARLDYKSQATEHMQQFCSWISTNLDSFCKILQENNEIGILSWICNPDAIVISMRLFYAAKVLLLTKAFGCADINTEALRKNLQKIHDIGKGAGGYEPWVAGAKFALESNNPWTINPMACAGSASAVPP